MQQMQNAYCKHQINTRQQCYVYYEIMNMNEYEEANIARSSQL